MKRHPSGLVPGIHLDISEADYDRLDAVRNSHLVRFRRTAAHARSVIEDPDESSAAQVIGSALHKLVLEPDDFAYFFALAPSQQKKSAKDQKAWKAMEEKFPDCRLLRPSEWNLVHRMRDSILRHPVARELVGGDGVNEATLLWQDEKTGVWCKARPDRLRQGYRNVWDDQIQPAMIDIKTSRDASEYEFRRSIWQYGYDVQSAHYLEGANALSGGVERAWVFIVVENELDRIDPGFVAVYQMEDAGLERGRRLWRRYLDAYADAVRNDHWPGYPAEVSLIGPPHWAYKTEGVETDE